MLRDEEQFLNKVAGKLSVPVAFSTSHELHTFSIRNSDTSKSLTFMEENGGILIN